METSDQQIKELIKNLAKSMADSLGNQLLSEIKDIFFCLKHPILGVGLKAW